MKETNNNDIDWIALQFYSAYMLIMYIVVMDITPSRAIFMSVVYISIGVCGIIMKRIKNNKSERK